MPLPPIGATISKEEFNKLPKVGETISADQFKQLQSTGQPSNQPFGNVPPPSAEALNPRPQPTGLEKASNILDTLFGGKQVGEAIGTQIAKLMVKPEERYLVDKGPTAGQIAGDLGQIGLTLATLGLPEGLAAKVGLKALPALGSGLKGAKALGAVAGIGSGFGVTGALKGGETNPLAIAASGLGGAALGTTLGLGEKAISLAGKLIVNSPERLVNYALKVPSKKAEQGIAEAFLKRGLGGKSLATIIDTTHNEVTTLGQEIDQILSTKTGGLSPRETIKNIVKESNLNRSTNLSVQELQSRIKKFAPDVSKLLDKPELSWRQANQLRDALDTNLKEASFLGKELTGEQRAVKKFTDTLRSLIKEGTGTNDLFKQQSEAIRIRNVARDALKKLETQGRPGLLDVMGAGVGGTLGGIPGAVVGVGLERAMRSPTVLGAGARGMNIASKGVTKLSPILQKLTPAERAVIFNLFSKGEQALQ